MVRQSTCGPSPCGRLSRPQTPATAPSPEASQPVGDRVQARHTSARDVGSLCAPLHGLMGRRAMAHEVWDGESDRLMPSTLPVHAVARNVRFHHWKLGCKPSSLGHITRALHRVGCGVCVPTSAFPPCSCAVRLSSSGKADGPEVSLLTSPACGRDVTRRFHGAPFLAPGDPNEIAPCGESISSPCLARPSSK